MITREAEIEVNHWHVLCEEAKAAGIDANIPRFTPLFRAIALWGESLVALRITQTERQRKIAASMALERYNAVKKQK